MKGFSLGTAIVVLLAFNFSNGVQLVQSSAAFSFPQVAVDDKALSRSASGFSAKSLKHSVLFSWTVKSAIKEGSISIFKPNGKKVRQINLSKSTGSAVWNHKSDTPGMGIYLAEITFGDFKKETRFVIVK